MVSVETKVSENSQGCNVNHLRSGSVIEIFKRAFMCLNYVQSRNHRVIKGIFPPSSNVSNVSKRYAIRCSMFTQHDSTLVMLGTNHSQQYWTAWNIS